MIKYDIVENKYLYNMDDLENVIKVIEDGNFYNFDDCTKEKISDVVAAIEKFISNIKTESVNVTLERHETEEEARAYFGDDFINQLNNLFTTLDKQETIVALHGTDVGSCPSICQNGLMYKLPSLSSTAVQQHMEYGQKDIEYNDFEGLLNWGHKEYKGLIILAIPYECYYKDGLWNKYQDSNLGIYGVQDYKIDPDFVVGYIDVVNKKIVLNPKYSREHNYTNYIKDNDIYRDNLSFNNELFKKISIDSNKLMEENVPNNSIVNNDFDPKRIPYVLEDLIGTFNSIKVGFPDGMTEKRYKDFLEELSYGFNGIKNSINALKTNDEIKRERENFLNTNNTSVESSINVNDIDWGDDFDWDTSSSEEEDNKSMRFI